MRAIKLTVTCNRVKMNKDNEWNKYASKTLKKFLASLPEDGIRKIETESIDIENIINSKAKDAFKVLKTCISKNNLDRYRNRFRQHQHRVRNEVANITLKESSLKRLELFKNKIGADTFDEAIDFLLSPEYEDFKEEVKEAQQMMAIEEYTHNGSYFKNLIRWLPKYQLGRLNLIVESAFKDGWKKAKASKKRSGDPINEALGDNEIIKELSRWISNIDQ